MAGSASIGFAALMLASLAALLLAEYRESRTGVWIAKPLASAGFVGVAIASGATGSGYGLWVLAALVLSFLGDVLLIPREPPLVFRAGLLSFLLGHLAFAVAFAARGLAAPGPVMAAAAAAGLVGFRLMRWLRPHLPDDMVLPVVAYVVVISSMLVLACGATLSSGDARIAIGASMFYLSDLAVARDRFVVSTFLNRAWGLPLYYGAQLVLASSVHGEAPALR